MNILDTPLYKESVALQRRQGHEVTDALKRCRSDNERTACIYAYARLHWAEQDALGQRHGCKPMLWPVNGIGLPIFTRI